MKNTAQDIRTEYARQSDLQRDEAQSAVVEKLADLQNRLMRSASQQKRWPSWLPGRRGSKPVRGIYLWGDVGRGKTFLMDLFFATLNVEEKRRTHFHRMMSEVHHRLKALTDKESPLGVVAETLAKDFRVLCFDEFFVQDIGDAMILAQLLDGLFEHGVTLVATSNSPPAELYRDGLQRSRFLPAIDLLETHTDVVELGAGADYRLRALAQAGTYLIATAGDAHERLAHFVERVAPGPVEARQALSILGREIPTVRVAKGVVWFEFDVLCRGPRSQEDYINIARCYQTVVLSGVPVMTRDDEDAARRFIALIDEFYDRRVKLVIAAAAPIVELYQGNRLEFEYRRTESRLIEMQSTDYLKEPHLS